MKTEDPETQSLLDDGVAGVVGDSLQSLGVDIILLPPLLPLLLPHLLLHLLHLPLNLLWKLLLDSLT
jgi:hypothetical protein